MNKLIVQVNPYLEFINSILLTSKYNEITTPFVGYGLMTDEINEYTKAIKNHFDGYGDFVVYSTIEEMIPYGFTFSRPVELMLSLGNSDDFTMQYSLSDLCLEYCGGVEKTISLLRLLKSIAKDTEYFLFFESVKSFYNPILEKVNDHIQQYSFVAMLENQYGKEQRSYNYIVSGLMKGNFGINFVNKKSQSVNIYSVFSTENISDDINVNEFSGGALSAAIVFHEFSHPFINPLTDKYYSIAEKYQAAYECLKKYKLTNYSSGYGDWKECINEHFVRAMAIHLLKKCGRNEWANERLKYDLFRGYKYIPAILERYSYYDNHREQYRTFDEFYPTLLNVFKCSV